MWSHNGRVVFIDKRYEGSEPGRHTLDDKYAKNYNLIISNIKMTDSGVYKCRSLITTRVLIGYNLTVSGIIINN